MLVYLSRRVVVIHGTETLWKRKLFDVLGTSTLNAPSRLSRVSRRGAKKLLFCSQVARRAEFFCKDLVVRTSVQRPYSSIRSTASIDAVIPTIDF